MCAYDREGRRGKDRGRDRERGKKKGRKGRRETTCMSVIMSMWRSEGYLQKSVHACMLSALPKQGLSCFCCWLHNDTVWTSQLTIGVLCSHHTSQPFIWVLGMELRRSRLRRYLSHLLGHLPDPKINFLLATNYLKLLTVLNLGF